MPSVRTKSPRVRHPLFARIYPKINAFAEAHGALEHRQELLADTTGLIVEVGAGTGANFAHYPPAVEKVIAVEPEAHLRARAAEAASRCSTDVELRAGRAEHLPVDDASADGVVLSLVLCSIADPAAALEEAARVLRPGGRLYFYEHVRSANPQFAKRQHRINIVWPWFAGGCNLDRDSEGAITEAGFIIEHARRFDFLINGRTTPSSPCVIGTAINAPR